MPDYCVIYSFDQGLPVQTKVPEYSSIGVRFCYREDGLTTIIHDFHESASLTKEEIRCQSERSLLLLWNVMEFRYGLPIKPSRVRTEIVGQSPAEGLVAAGIDAAVCKAISLPNDSLFAGVGLLRLSAWLQFSNNARNTPSDSEAVKLYYNILEDMYGRPNQNSNPAAIRVKHARDFVSHGKKLDNCDLRAFLVKEIGCKTDQYDPNDPKHRKFVESERKTARTFVEAEIEKRLV